VNTPIRLHRGGFALTLLPLGATLHRFEVELPDGSWRNVVVSRDDPDAAHTGFLGATVGRCANRIGKARFDLEGRSYHLVANEGENQLHGGPGGFSERIWQVAEVTEDSATFTVVSEDGDQGYPGRVVARATYTVGEDGAEVVYRARTDAATPVNLTAHPYFRLGGSSIDDHRLTVPASAYTPVDAAMIPTGEIRPVTGTALDFRAGVRIQQACAEAVATGLDAKGGIDHNLVVDGSGWREHVCLEGPDGLTLRVFSDAPAVQLYSGERIDRAGLAIEPQGFPDAPNHDNFPSVILQPGREYLRRIRWSFTRAAS